MPQAKVLKVKGTPCFDIFIGEGWRHWTRVCVRKGKQPTIEAGALLSQDQLTSILGDKIK